MCVRTAAVFVFVLSIMNSVVLLSGIPEHSTSYQYFVYISYVPLLTVRECKDSLIIKTNTKRSLYFRTERYYFFSTKNGLVTHQYVKHSYTYTHMRQLHTTYLVLVFYMHQHAEKNIRTCLQQQLSAGICQHRTHNPQQRRRRPNNPLDRHPSP